MLRKLLKYDLKYMLKNMSIFYILSIFFAVTTRIFFSLNQTVVINVIGQITVGFLYSFTASTLFNTIIRSYVRFKDSLYKDESYLTHTLPVSKKQLYESRFLESIIFTCLSFIIIFISLFITYYTKERWDLLTNTINSLGTNLNINTTTFVISVIVIFFLEIVNVIQSGFLGIILGNQKNNYKSAYSILFGFIYYMLSQGVVLLFIYIIGLFDSKIMNIFTSTYFDNSILNRLICIVIFIYIIVIILMNIFCVKKLNKGVNIE